MARTLRQQSTAHAATDTVGEAVVDYCARPLCRREFRRSVGPGRPRDYCSDTCRRSAQKELRLTQQRLAHFEGLVAQLRCDVAAFTVRGDHDSVNDPAGAARRAVTQARGALPFLQQADDPGARAFVALLRGVETFIDGG